MPQQPGLNSASAFISSIQTQIRTVASATTSVQNDIVTLQDDLKTANDDIVTLQSSGGSNTVDVVTDETVAVGDILIASRTVPSRVQLANYTGNIDNLRRTIGVATTAGDQGDTITMQVSGLMTVNVNGACNTGDYLAIDFTDPGKAVTDGVTPGVGVFATEFGDLGGGQRLAFFVYGQG